MVPTKWKEGLSKFVIIKPYFTEANINKCSCRVWCLLLKGDAYKMEANTKVQVSYYWGESTHVIKYVKDITKRTHHTLNPQKEASNPNSL